jgi:hypothetical protein
MFFFFFFLLLPSSSSSCGRTAGPAAVQWVYNKELATGLGIMKGHPQILSSGHPGHDFP